jgi:hypothetical protein
MTATTPLDIPAIDRGTSAIREQLAALPVLSELREHDRQLATGRAELAQAQREAAARADELRTLAIHLADDHARRTADATRARDEATTRRDALKQSLGSIQARRNAVAQRAESAVSRECEVRMRGLYAKLRTVSDSEHDMQLLAALNQLQPRVVQEVLSAV